MCCPITNDGGSLRVETADLVAKYRCNMQCTQCEDCNVRRRPANVAIDNKPPLGGWQAKQRPGLDEASGWLARVRERWNLQQRWRPPLLPF